MRRIVINLHDDRPFWDLPAWAQVEIRRAVPADFEIVEVETAADSRGDGGLPSDEAMQAIAGAEVYLGYGFSRELLDQANREGDTLRWVHSGNAGVRKALFREMIDSDVALTNSAGIHAEPMADTVMGMVHHFARGFDVAVRAQLRGQWDKSSFDAAGMPVREIAGSVLGVLGFGGIGQGVGRRGAALGMHVLAHRRTRGAPIEGVEVLYGDEGLRKVLRESHYLVVTLPLTAETDGLLDRERLATLREDAVIINVGRGQLIDEDALLECLAQGRIRGAGLDVFSIEPLPEGSPFWSLPNVLITPHVSAATPGFWRRQVKLIVENLERYGRGEELLNLVDKRAGY